MRYLLDTLEDPFEMFPMQSVVRSFAVLANESENDRIERMHPWSSASPNYRTVEDEHEIEVVELLIGSAFVLGQAAIAQAVAIVKRIHEDARKPLWIPGSKDEIMETAAPEHNATGLSKISIINAAANYYKHRYEWWDDWSGPLKSKPTIDVVVKLGLLRNGDRNLQRALWALEIHPDNLTPLAQIIGEWRSQLAKEIETQLIDHRLLPVQPPQIWR